MVLNQCVYTFVFCGNHSVIAQAPMPVLASQCRDVNEMNNKVITSNFHVCPRGGTVLKAFIVDPAYAHKLRFIMIIFELAQPRTI